VRGSLILNPVIILLASACGLLSLRLRAVREDSPHSVFEALLLLQIAGLSG